MQDSETRKKALEDLYKAMCRDTGHAPNIPFHITEEQKRKNREQIKLWAEMKEKEKHGR